MPAKGYSKSKFEGKMCIDLINMFTNGDTREDFCAKYSISEDTFSRWIDTYPMFFDAYMVAIPKAKSYYNKILKDNLIEEYKGSRLNTRALELIMRNRFEMPQNRIVKLAGLNARTSSEKLDAIANGVVNGQLTPDEAQKLCVLVEATIKASSHDELEERIKQIEQANKIGLEDNDFKEVTA